MIKTQVVKENNKPVAVIMDYKEYLRLKEIAEDRADYYSAAEVLVMPSHYESFGMVALEAMACGTPVIASDVGGLGFLVQDGETGYTIPDGEPDLMCEKLSMLLSDTEVRTRMGRRAAEVAQSYSWDKIAKQIMGVYDELTRVKEA